MKKAAQFSRRQKGSVAIEFAIVGLWLVVLLGAIIEVGVFLLIQFELQNATDRTARLIRTGTVTSDTKLEDFKNDICARVRIRNCTKTVYVDVRKADSFAALAEAMPVKVNQAPSVGPENKENFDLGKTGPIGSLIITYDWKMIFPFMTIFRNRPDGVRRLYGISVFRIEE